MRFSRTISSTSVCTIVSELQVSYSVCASTYLFLLLVTEQSAVSSEDQLFDDVRQVAKEVHADWYSLAIELGIDYETRKVRLVHLVLYELYHLKLHQQAIERNYRFVDVCFHAVLRDFVKTTSPSLMWTALVRALKSPVINRLDIANNIEAKQVRFVLYQSLWHYFQLSAKPEIS